jgi:Ca2+-binding RTX toxin-like protein
MNANGSGQTRLTTDPAADLGPRPVPNVRCNGRPATLLGTKSRQSLTGGPNRDVVHAFGADDKPLKSFKGRDDVCAGSGDDVVRAGRGDDAVNGGKGDDQLRGGKGNDEVAGGKGNDRLWAGRGRDALNGGKGFDICFGSSRDRFKNCDEVR